MTSQKRYRHHQENSNNSARFRDLPPRFKRQKSSSTPSPPRVQANHISDTETSHVNSSPKKSGPKPQSPTSSQMAPALTQEEMADQKRCESASEVHLRSPRAAVSSPGALQWTQRNTSPPQPALTPVNSSAFNFPRNVWSPPINHMPAETHFTVQTSSAMMHPWVYTGMPGYSVQTSVAGSQPWMPSQASPYQSQRLFSPPGFSQNNENQAPSPRLGPQVSPANRWAFSPQPSPCLSTSSSQRGPRAIVKATEEPHITPKVEKSDAKPAVDLSDPDIRTIEMLKELERVADQKEIEDESNGTDRKSLVSHHLRMLMCAVDRYTEGVEDEIAMSSRSDEAASSAESPASTPAHSPVPSKTWQQERESDARKQPRTSTPNPKPAMWNDSYSNSPMWEPSTSRSAMLPSPVHTNSPVQISQPTAAPRQPQAFPAIARQMSVENLQARGWDLWSSPSFDFCGVLSIPLAEDLNNNMMPSLFEVGKGSGKERKPLYQR